VEVTGRVATPSVLSLEDIKRWPARTLRVTLECAGNGRGLMSPRYPSMPWAHEAVGTAEWTGTPLRHLLERVGLAGDAIEVAFIGADRGFDRGQEHAYGRSLPREVALGDDVLLVWAMNGAPLLPQHGAPLRLIVPGWYGMASVKWIERIEALATPYQGLQQVSSYMYRPVPDGPSTPVTHMRVKSLLVPPGIPDFYTRARMVEAGPVTLFGRAWSGGGVDVARVEVGIDGAWHEARLERPQGRHAWRGWSWVWNAEPGGHVLSCRATDAAGETQPLKVPWDTGGFGNNAVQRVQVWVR
jgi:DMSO/TMAO reductase YedYZ molybdopterin-dependent catalytic subunit